MRPEHEWAKDFSNVLELAAWLEDDCVIVSAMDAIRFFRDPWKWSEEYSAMRAGFASMTDYELREVHCE